MKYLNSFNSVGALNNFYKGKDYKEPNVNVIKTSENEDPIVDMNSEYDIICFFDTTENLNGSPYLLTDYDKTSLESIIVDGNRYRVKDLPLNKSDLEPGEHIIKLKYKNKTIFGNLNNSPVFFSNYLRKVIIPKGIENIYPNACNGCTSLTNITIPDSVTSIGGAAFGGCPLKSIYINFNEFNNGSGFNYLGLYPTLLKSVILGNRVNNIPNSAFGGCSALTNITISDSVTSIGNGAFGGCTTLTSITIPDSVTSIGNSAFGGCTALTSITIPDSVTSIGNSAFGGCTALTSITIPNSVTSIGDNAFYNTKLSNINISNNLTSIGYSAFNLNYNTRSNVYFDNSTINNLGNIIDPSVIKNLEIGQHAITQNGELCLTTFSGFGNMESITFPEGLTVLPNLYGSSSLKTFNIPSTVITINDNYLYGCNSLEDSYIEDGIRYIDIDNFGTYIIDVIDLTLQHYTIKNGVKGLPFTFNSSFTNIQSITLPNSLTNIADGAFDYLYGNNILTQEQIDFILNINENGISKISKMMSQSKSYFEDKYFTICALESGTLYYDFTDSSNSQESENYKVLEYSKDDGETWLSINNIQTSSKNINISKNDIILLRSNITPIYTGSSSATQGIGNIYASFKYYVCGNIMSLLYGDNFKNQISLSGKNHAFDSLFSLSNHNYSSYKKLIRADKLILPATTLADSCYASMFSVCSSLTTAPELSATTLAKGCYYNMFYSCTSLVIAPELPATTLAEGCYRYMFSGCTSLTTAPELSATTLVQYCYNNMFSGCTSLTTAPELPATTLVQRCYAGMFYKCTSLTTAPELQATTLAEECYSEMFENCTALTTAPELPATTLTYNCYRSMFSGCTSLTTAPELPATTLANYCYYEMFKSCTSLVIAPELHATILTNYCYIDMFNGCTSLNKIIMLATNISATGCLYSWVKGVSATGTLIKAASMTTLPSGVSGIPSGWTVQDYVAS